eukprot:8786674-Heterocapsa_arctica.AAC.1
MKSFVIEALDLPREHPRTKSRKLRDVRDVGGRSFIHGTLHQIQVGEAAGEAGVVPRLSVREER